MTAKEALRAKIQGKAKRTFVAVDAGGDEYLIQSLNLREKGESEALLFTKSGTLDRTKIHRQKCDLLCRSVVDPETKTPLFETSEWEVWDEVSSAVTSKLLNVIESLNDGKEVEGILGN